MITLDHANTRSRLEFRFREVHEDAKCAIHFQRTLRIPDDGKTYLRIALGNGGLGVRRSDCGYDKH